MWLSHSVIWSFVIVQRLSMSNYSSFVSTDMNLFYIDEMFSRNRAEELYSLKEIKFNCKLEKLKNGPCLCMFSMGKYWINNGFMLWKSQTSDQFLRLLSKLHQVRIDWTWKKCVRPISGEYLHHNMTQLLLKPSQSPVISVFALSGGHRVYSDVWVRY